MADLPLDDTLEYAGRFGGRYRVRLGKYTGPDFSRACLIFPGQASAYPGMFREHLDRDPGMQELFHVADALARRRGLPPASAYVTEAETIAVESLPLLQNLALFTVEVGIGRWLLAHGTPPVAVTSHSFGEFAAFVVAGMAPFDQMLGVVLERDLACPPPGELGRLVAILGTADDVAALLADVPHTLSNFNSPKQTVAAVATGDLEAAEETLSAAEVGFKVLTRVAQPYHSPLLGAARERFALALDGVELQLSSPAIPLLSSVTGEWVSPESFDAERALRLLGQQLVAPVRFVDQVRALHQRARCYTFVEAGPRSTSVGFVRQILDGEMIKTRTAEALIESGAAGGDAGPAIDPALASNKFFGLVANVISAVTGHDVKAITVEDRFQDNLGIDSIKKAEIVLRVLNEANLMVPQSVELARIDSIADTIALLTQVEREPGKNAPARERDFRCYVRRWEPEEIQPCSLVDERPVSLLHQELEELLRDPAAVSEAVAQHVRGTGSALPVVSFWCPRSPIDLSPDASACKGFIDRAVRLLRAFDAILTTTGDRYFEIILVTEACGSSLGSGAAAALKSLKKERQSFGFCHLQFAEPTERGPKVDEIMAREVQSIRRDEISYRDGVRHVMTLVERQAPEAPHLPPGAVLVALGGGKGITFELLRTLPQAEQIHLVVVGRTDVDSPDVGANIADLEDRFAEVHYVQQDVRDYAALVDCLAEVGTRHGKIDLILHAAGVERSRPLIDKPEAEIQAELETKLVPLFAIDALAQHQSIGEVVTSSSVVAQFGNAGQAVYALANAVLDHRARAAADGGTIWRSVLWPPWDGVGMTADPVVSLLLSGQGIALLDVEPARELFVAHALTGPERSILFLDQHDEPAYRFGLSNFVALESVVGTLQTVGGLSFERQVGLQSDAVLEDHRFEGICYFPAAFYLGSCLGVAALLGCTRGSLESFFIRMPLVVETEPQLLALRIIRTRVGLQLSIRTRIEHTVCFLTNEIGEEAPDDSDVRCTTSLGQEAIYHGIGWHLGPHFQTLNGLRMSPAGDRGLVSLRLGEPPWAEMAAAERIQFCLDAAFQSVAVLGSLRTGRAGIPAACGRIAFDLAKPLTDVMTLQVELTWTGEAGFTGNCRVVNEQGELLFDLRGIQNRHLSTARQSLAARP